jgi:APA family basic amino acid/polyamine antiporter
MVTYASEETLAPERTIPRALVIGVLLVTACYVALNAAYLHVLSIDAVIHSRGVAADAVEAVMGPGGATLAAAVVVISTLGALNGIVLAGPRVYYAMAQDRLLFAWIGAVHPRYRTPHRAIALQCLWTVVLVLTGTYETLFSRVIYTEWIFFGVMALALIPLRRRPGYAPAFRVRGHPALPLLFALVAFAVAANQIASSPVDAVIGIGLVLSGLPVYWLWVAGSR